MTGVFDQGGTGDDVTMFAEGIVENEHDLEEAITIRKAAAASSTPDALGQAPGVTFTDFPATAVMISLGTSGSLLIAGVLSAGDIHLQIRERLNESNENAGGSQPGDHVIFRGSEYRIVQRPEPVVVGDVTFYNTFLRRINGAGDTAGL